MKIILTCGHPYSGHQAVAELLQHCGVAEALPSRNNQYFPAALQSKIFEVYEWNAETSTQPLPEPGKVWQELSSDLFIGNLSQPLWGWGDHQTVWLMDFWKAFDPQIRFLLVYSAPEFLVCNMLQQQVDAPEDMNVILNGWHRYNAELLRFYNRHQDRCLLVNAQTALQQPQALIEKLIEAFSLSLKSPDEIATAMSTSRVAAGLACSLIHSTSPTEQNALYQEIESTADIISSGIKPSTQERLQAWSEYNYLIQKLNKTFSLGEKYQEELIILKEQQADLEQKAHSNLAKNYELKQENDLLFFQLQQMQICLEQCFLEKNELNEAKTQIEINIKKKQQEIESLKTYSADLKANIYEKQQKVDLLQADNSNLKSNLQKEQQDVGRLKTYNLEIDINLKNLQNENEILLQQLHKIQAELKYYFTEYQKFNSIPTKPSYDLLGISYNPCKEPFIGNNWYDAEHDGRWAGPNPISTIDLPVLDFEGNYKINLYIIGSMSEEIINKMKLFLNGIYLKSVILKEKKRWRINKAINSYPLQVYTRFKKEHIPIADGIWQLELHFPFLLSPSECNLDPQDKRKLAIRLNKIEFIKD